MKKLTFTLISLLTTILLTGCLTANQVADVMEKTLMQLSAEQKAERAQREETVMAVSTSGYHFEMECLLHTKSGRSY